MPTPSEQAHQTPGRIYTERALAIIDRMKERAAVDAAERAELRGLVQLPSEPVQDAVRETIHTVTSEPGLLLEVPAADTVKAKWAALRDGKNGLGVKWSTRPFNRTWYAALSGAINDVLNGYADSGDPRYAPSIAALFVALEAGDLSKLPPVVTIQCDKVWRAMLASE